MCKVDPTFQPTEIIADAASRGNLDDVLADGQLWKCLECYTCQEMCHSDIGMAETFRKLKELAMEAGTGPSRSPRRTRRSSKTGALGKPKESARKKLGLDAAARDAAATSLGRLLDDEGEE